MHQTSGWLRRTFPRFVGRCKPWLSSAARLLPYAAAVGIVALLLWQIDPRQVVGLLLGADWRWLLVGFAAYALTNVLRAYRFGVLLDLQTLSTDAPYSKGGDVGWAGRGSGDASLPDVHANDLSAHAPEHLRTHHLPRAASAGHRAGRGGPRTHRLTAPLRILPEMFALSLFNNTLPSRSGELSFPYFMWRRHGMAVGESTAALLVVRIFDYLAVGLLYVALWLLFGQQPTSSQPLAAPGHVAPESSALVSVVAGLLLLSVLVLAAMPWLGRQAMRVMDSLMARLGLKETRIVALLLRGGWRAVAAFERMRTPRAYVATMAWSLVVWLATFAWFAAFMQAMGLGMPYPEVVIGATFAMLAKAIPFITVGGFGAHEAGWALGFGLLGMPTATAIASGFAVNILTLVASAVFGGFALIYMRWDGRGHRHGRGGQTKPFENAQDQAQRTVYGAPQQVAGPGLELWARSSPNPGALDRAATASPPGNEAQ